MAGEVMGAKVAEGWVEGKAVWDLAAEMCARGRRECELLQHCPVLTHVLQ